MASFERHWIPASAGVMFVLLLAESITNRQKILSDGIIQAGSLIRA